MAASFHETIVLTLVRNINRKDVRTIKLNSSSLAEHDGATEGGPKGSLVPLLIQAAANKFKLKRKDVRLFDGKSGLELVAGNGDCEAVIKTGATIMVSAGEENIAAGAHEAAADAVIEGSGQQGAAAEADVIVLAKESPVEAAAVKQLHWVARLPGVFLTVGLPDLHPGPTCPIGTAVASSGIIYPDLVGSDIGCGIMLVCTSLPASAAEKPRTIENWADAVDLEGGWGGDVAAYLYAEGVAPSAFDTKSLGTVGRGNHFAELQAVDSIEDQAVASQLGLSAKKLVLCVHSGSRGFGESILKQHVEAHGPNTGLSEFTPPAIEYLERHTHACAWARVNRQLIAQRLLGQLSDTANLEPEVILDVCHNNVVRIPTDVSGGQSAWLHRKGAAPSDCGPVVIPGSRGSHSFLVIPTEGARSSGWSLAHGAGRQVARTQALAAGRARYPKATELCTTTFGSRVVCDDKDLLYEEVPEAYKDIGCVVKDLIDLKLCKVVATLRPVLTYKAKAPPWARGK